MESVEDLMVGKIAYPARVIDEALMDRWPHRREFDIIASIFEDGLETFCLIGGVGEYHDAITLGEHSAEGVGYQVEVLMIETLERAVELQCGLCTETCRSIPRSIIYLTHPLESGFEVVGIDHLLHGIRITLVGYQRRL